MKYHVYAALIATTQAGPLADELHKKMPTVEEVRTLEKNVGDWIKESEKLELEMEPIVQYRHAAFEKAGMEADMDAEEKFMTAEFELKKAGHKAKKEIVAAQMKFESDMKKLGVDKDFEALGHKIESDLNKCSHTMRRVRLDTMKLKSNVAQNVQQLSFADDYEKMKPTKEEIASVENTLDGWAQRAEKIHNDATPAVENAKMKIAVAWHEKEKADEKAWYQLVGELEVLEEEFETTVMKNQAIFEKTITDNGAVADWKKLEAQIEADLKTMAKVHSKVQSLNNRVNLLRAASAKYTTTLVKCSEQLKKDKITAAEFDKAKATVKAWAHDYEDIMVKVQPGLDERDAKMEHAAEEFFEDFEDTAEDLDEGLEDTAEDFIKKAEYIDFQSEKMWNEKKLTEKYQALGDKIEKDLNDMEAVYKKTHMIKKDIAVSLAYKSDELFDALPSGARVEAAQDKYINWVSQGEDIEMKVLPAAEIRDKANKKALEEAYYKGVDSVLKADTKWQENDLVFQKTAEDTVEGAFDYLDKKGTIGEMEALDHDIETQFKAWGMAKRDPVVALTALQNQDLKDQLRSIEADIDMVLMQI